MERAGVEGSDGGAVWLSVGQALGHGILDDWHGIRVNDSSPVHACRRMAPSGSRASPHADQARHGHAASILHAFAPVVLRAVLAQCAGAERQGCTADTPGHAVLGCARLRRLRCWRDVSDWAGSVAGSCGRLRSRQPISGTGLMEGRFDRACCSAGMRFGHRIRAGRLLA